MMDVGHDTGYSREFSDSAEFASPGFATGRQPLNSSDAGGADAYAGRAVTTPVPVAPAAQAEQAGSRDLPQDLPLAGRPLSGLVPDLAGIDLAALQALTGLGGSAGDPASTIARQVADMAQGLAALADKLVGQPAPSSQDVLEADCIAFLEGQFRIRRLRGRHLPGLSLGEPAWDILLDLAIAHYWRRETSVTSLCIAADVPSTTALRWINSMTKAGLIVRRPCQRDGRRSFLAIAPASYQAMLALAADALRTVERVRSRYQRNAA